MNIQEAVHKAAEEDKMIVREKFYQDNGEHFGAIDPSNSYECCRIMKKMNGKWTQRERCWNPTLEDLIANDWILITKE